MAWHRVVAGHRVVDAGMPGMAARQAAQRQQTPPERAVPPHGLQRVLRAGGIEAAARPEYRAHQQLIGTDQQLQSEVHRGEGCNLSQSRSRLARSSALAAARALARTPTTMSSAGIELAACSRKLSRIMRRSRLRSTAPPMARTATDIPSRARSSSLRCVVTVKNSFPMRRPLLYTRLNSAAVRRRRVRGKPSGRPTGTDA